MSPGSTDPRPTSDGGEQGAVRPHPAPPGCGVRAACRRRPGTAPDASDRKTGTAMTIHRPDAPPTDERPAVGGRGRTGSTPGVRSSRSWATPGGGTVTGSPARRPDDVPGEDSRATVAACLRLAA